MKLQWTKKQKLPFILFYYFFWPKPTYDLAFGWWKYEFIYSQVHIDPIEHAGAFEGDILNVKLHDLERMARYAQYSIPLDFKVILSLLLLVVHSAEKRMGEKRMGKHCGNTHVTFQSVEDRKA